MEDEYSQLSQINRVYDLMLWKGKYLGNNSELYKEVQNIKNMSIEEKRTIGKAIQQKFNSLNEAVKDRMKQLKQTDDNEGFDLPFYSMLGTRHIVTETIEKMHYIFSTMGFEFIDCPEIETNFRCFTALNVPDHHACQNAHQSFHLKNGNILRSHCTTMDTYVLEKYSSPGKFYTIGRTFRYEQDRTHSPMFHQIDMVKFGPGGNLKSLIETIKTFFMYYFEKDHIELRLRPSYFPFTEPSYEVDLLHNDKWLEVLGCGVLHPNCYEYVNSSMPYGGWAMGMGLERLIMIKHNIKDIRLLYS